MFCMCVFILFYFSSRRRHTRCALVTGVQTCALPISSSFSWCQRLDRKRVDALTRQVAERPVHHPLARDAILPREARPLDRQAEMRFAAAVVAGMDVMLRAVVAEGEIRIGKSGDRKSTRLNSSHYCAARMPPSA